MGLNNTPSLRGVNKMIANLKKTQAKTARKIERASISAGLTPATKAIRSGVNGTSADARLKKAARKTIGRSVKRKRLGESNYQGKVGFGVGKPSKKKRAAATARAKGGHGIGLSAANIHWFVLGTAARYHKSGRFTGILPAYLEGIVPRSMASARGLIKDAMRQKAKQVLARETAKLSK